MRTALCLSIFGGVAFSILLTMSAFADADAGNDFSQRWDYPNNSAGGVGKSTGPVSISRSTRRTTDSPEKVILWYAERVGLADDHSLVENAKLGFSKLDSRLDIRANIVGDGDDNQKSHLSILGTITSKHAHATMIYRPDHEKQSDIVISITQTPDGTNVHVIGSD